MIGRHTSYLSLILGLLLSSCSVQHATPRAEMIIPTLTLSPCTARADFGDPSRSPYALPYPPGKTYRISQSYCFPDGSHADQLAYDFEMPVGVDITASRDGVVLEIKEDTPDTGGPEYLNLHNFILIKHEDGSVAFYAHLKQDSILVEAGDLVTQGQVIAESGNSGFTGFRPQLHFGVYQSDQLQEGEDIGVNFCNAAGPLDSRGGLIEWRYYEALPY